MQKILTVAIPTYNGERYIHDALESVLSQVTEKHYSSIDILVVDNNSRDNTNIIVKQFQNKFPNLIKYICNDRNIGYDRNIDKIFQLAQSEYVKILADDDAFYPGALEQHLNLISTHPDVDCFQMNFNIYDTELNNVINKLEVNNSKDIYCPDGSQFLEKSANRFGQVSSLMIRRTKWLENDPSEGYGTNYIHVYMLFKIINTGIAYISSLPMIKVRSGSPNFETNSDNSILIPMGTIKIYKYFIIHGKFKKEYKAFLSEQIKYSVLKIIHAKRIGLQNSKSTFTKVFKNHYDSLFYWSIFLPLLLIPTFLYKTIFQVYQITKKTCNYIKSKKGDS